MKKAFQVILPLILLLVTALAANAQHDEDIPIPACSGEEVALLVLEIRQFAGDFVEFDQALMSISDVTELQAKTEELDALQRAWWSEIVPELPLCSLALDISVVFGRTLDEYLAYILLLQAGYPDLAEEHRMILSVVGSETSAIASLILDSETALIENLTSVSDIIIIEIPYVVVGRGSINARSCPMLSCNVVRQLTSGEEFAVVGISDGDAVNGSTQWLHFIENGTDIYVHSSLAIPA